jgi:hypothetical protein
VQKRCFCSPFSIPLFPAPILLFFHWRERQQRDGSGKKGNSTFSFFNLKLNLDNINEKKLKIRPDIKLKPADFFKKFAFH